MDLLLQSDTDSETDEILEVTKEIHPGRSNYRNKQLLKMFAIREILKWKYNYFETNAEEHPLYKICEKVSSREFRKSFAFKKLWRLRMDKAYDVETIKMHKIFLERQLKKLNQSQNLNSSLPQLDPARLLMNYDREVLSMIHRVRDEFNFYMLHPKSYPLYEAEKNNFLIDHCIEAASKNITQITTDVIDKKFRNFWENRVGILCDLKITQEKKQIRRDWKRLLPIYHDLGEDTSCSELQELLLSDNEIENDDEN